MSAAPRLAMFGGAFDPPHNAHVALARAALGQLQLDELRIFPTGNAWHRGHAVTAGEHRLAMARLAFGGLANTIVDDREMHRAGPTYTIDTLRELRQEHPAAQLFLVIGEDQALALKQWREWQAIVSMAVIGVAARPDAPAHANLQPSSLPGQAQVRMLRLPSMTESATDIRERVARGEDVSSLVPPAVASYIASQHLYRSH